MSDNFSDENYLALKGFYIYKKTKMLFHLPDFVFSSEWSHNLPSSDLFKYDNLQA